MDKIYSEVEPYFHEIINESSPEIFGDMALTMRQIKKIIDCSMMHLKVVQYRNISCSVSFQEKIILDEMGI